MEIHIKRAKNMQENKAQIPFYTSPKERGPQPGKTGPNKRRTRINPNQITSSSQNTHIDPLKRSKGVDPPNMGQFGSLVVWPHQSKSP